MIEPSMPASRTDRGADIAHRWRVFAIVSVGVFMAGLDLFIVNIAFPDIERDFAGTSLAGLSWVLNAYAIVFAALLVPAGRISDRAGRKRGFLGGLALFLAASAALRRRALARGAGRRARVVQAAGAAFMMPTSLGLLLPEFPPAQRATAVGAWAAVGGVAAAAGPPIGGLLVEASWRWVFLVNVPVGLVALVVAARARCRSGAIPTRARRPDVLGAAMLARRHRALVLGIVKGPDWGWDSAGVLALVRAPRRARCRRSSCAPRATPRRSSSCRCCACARSRSRTSARCSSSRRSPRCCSQACSS